MAIKFTETQRALLGAAARRDDHYFILPEGRRLAAARRAADSLLTAGLAREVHAQSEAHVWRRDKDSQSAFALKLTAAGKKAIATVAEDCEGGSQQTPRREVETEPAPAARPSRRDAKGTAMGQLPASTTAPRSGTKIDNVVKMLGRSEGATLEAIIEATGWLPHSTYAALTGLRKRGYALERSRDDKGDPSVYRLAPPRQTSA